MITKELKQRWIEALRSGRYKQGKNYLKRGQYYCCLGVLCEVGIGSVKGSPWNQSNADLKTTVLSSGIQSELSRMNDGRPGRNKSTFSEIADWIEENVEVTDE